MWAAQGRSVLQDVQCDASELAWRSVPLDDGETLSNYSQLPHSANLALTQFNFYLKKKKERKEREGEVEKNG